MPRRPSRAQILREDHIRAVLSHEKAKIEDDQNKIPKIPIPKEPPKVDRTPIIIEAMMKRKLSRLRDELAQRKAEQYIKETLVARKGDLKSDYSDRIDIEEYRRISARRRSTIPRKVFGRVRLSQFHYKLLKPETREDDQSYNQSRAKSVNESHLTGSYYKEIKPEPPNKNIAYSPATENGPSRRMYKKLSAPDRRQSQKSNHKMAIKEQKSKGENIRKTSIDEYDHSSFQSYVDQCERNTKQEHNAKDEHICEQEENVESEDGQIEHNLVSQTSREKEQKSKNKKKRKQNKIAARAKEKIDENDEINKPNKRTFDRTDISEENGLAMKQEQQRKQQKHVKMKNEYACKKIKQNSERFVGGNDCLENDQTIYRQSSERIRDSKEKIKYIKQSEKREGQNSKKSERISQEKIKNSNLSDIHEQNNSAHVSNYRSISPNASFTMNQSKFDQILENKNSKQIKSERFKAEQNDVPKVDDIPLVVPENVPLDVPYYVYSMNSGLTDEPTLSDIYLPSDFSFDDLTEENQDRLLDALEEDSSHLLSELLHLTSSEEFVLSQPIDKLPRKKLSRVYSTCYRLASRARPHRKTSRTNANLVYQDVINATKENLNQSVFTNKQVGQGVQRLVNKEKRGLVQREEEIEPASIKNVTYGLSFGLLLYSLYKINTI